jgi:hypothetical protein
MRHESGTSGRDGPRWPGQKRAPDPDPDPESDSEPEPAGPFALVRWKPSLSCYAAYYSTREAALAAAPAAGEAYVIANITSRARRLTVDEILREVFNPARTPYPATQKTFHGGPR